MVFAVRGGGEFENAGWIETGKGFKRKRGTDILRFIHNDDGGFAPGDRMPGGDASDRPLAGSHGTATTQAVIRERI